MIYELPKSILIGDRAFPINSDFRCILDIMEVLNDENLNDQERGILALGFFYPGLEEIPTECYEEAIRKLFWFINCGVEEKKQNQKKLMDWEQDFRFIISPINRIIGHDIRGDAYLHWWTFMAAYMDIGECTFANILRIRKLKADGKKLDKQDAAWYRENREIVDIKTKYTEAEDQLLAAWGGVPNA